ncbi:hypothetical protein MYX04_02665 [Nitrospiraceae bacterium AH_259_D15_M11_P09]|nr:hypothetical protein [Nitrospiraceae bacterium AH_259_D15_M11_P09]
MRALHVSIATLAAAVVCMFPLMNGCTSKINEEQIQTVLEAVDKAANEKNADGILAHMADDVVVKVNVPNGRTSKTFSLNRDQYRRLLKEGYRVAQIYEFGRKGTRIKIARDGKSAKVSSRTYETMRNQNGSQRTDSLETATFELRNDKVVITKVESIERT